MALSLKAVECFTFHILSLTCTKIDLNTIFTENEVDVGIFVSLHLQSEYFCLINIVEDEYAYISVLKYKSGWQILAILVNYI